MREAIILLRFCQESMFAVIFIAGHTSEFHRADIANRHSGFSDSIS